MVEANLSYGIQIEPDPSCTIVDGVFDNIVMEQNARIGNNYYQVYMDNSISSPDQYTYGLVFSNSKFGPFPIATTAQRSLYLAGNIFGTSFIRCNFGGDDGDSINIPDPDTLTVFEHCRDEEVFGANFANNFISRKINLADTRSALVASITNVGDAAKPFIIPTNKQVTITTPQSLDAFLMVIRSDATGTSALFQINSTNVYLIYGTSGTEFVQGIPASGSIGIYKTITTNTFTIENQVGLSRQVAINLFGTATISISDPV